MKEHLELVQVMVVLVSIKQVCNHLSYTTLIVKFLVSPQ